MFEENEGSWSDEQIDKWKHNRCSKTHGNETFRRFHAAPEPESEAEPEIEPAAESESELIQETRKAYEGN